MKKLIHGFIGIMTMTALTLPALAEMGPAGGAMLGIRAAKAVKNQKEKKAEAQAEAEKLAKLKERYPKDVEEYQALLTSDPDAAKRKQAKMVDRYKEDTGEDLDKTYAVKHREGPIKELKERLSGSETTTPPTATAPAPAKEKPRGLIRGWLREGVDEVRGELSPK